MCTIRDAADTAHAQYSVGRAGLLRAVGELDVTGAWRGDGAGNLPTWLAARWQISASAARELVREAKALRARPSLEAALAAGKVSLDQCKALITICREGTDDEAWLEALPFWSLPELQREARRQVARELERKDDGVYFRMGYTDDERHMRGEFQLDPEDGAALMRAVDALVRDDTALRDLDRARARALVELTASSGESAPGRPTVLVSVDDSTLSGSEGAETIATLEPDGIIGADAARRLSCDASIQPIHKAREGSITGIGRASRTVPPWLRRVVEHRDGGRCTFPGCGRDRYLDCHHIVHWSQGGTTDTHNMLLTCWTHHKLLHEGGWSLRGPAGPHVTWLRPDGTPFEPRVRVVVDTS